jgi:superfamily II DNA or RNA helicase
MTELCARIRAGEEINSIIAAVTPGGGKSALPVILSKLLIPEHAERLLWVVPRNSLKYQGEAEFLDPRWKTLHRLRAVNGNEADPARGNGGYITTYQAIGQNPFVHAAELGRHKYILFLDEPHHVARESNWETALARIVYGATLVVYASGTLYRGDGRPIAFIDKAVGPVIRYTRGDALRDGAVSPVHFRTLDGSAEWENEDGTKGSVDSLEEAGDYSPQALFTALRTEYALELLWMCWRDYEREARSNPLAQMLVVAPSIKLAREYRNVLSRQIGIDVPIATSEDSKRARETIAAYRRGVYPVIVTVAMAYEGLSVPQISHIACLTHIRSVPWLEQCFARANRLAPGKTAGYIYGPADRKFLQAIHDIEAEQDQAIKEREGRETGEDTEEERTGETRPWINPLHSGVHEAGSFEELTFPPPRDFAPSELEKALRDQIRHLRRHVLNNTRRGNILSKTRIWNAIVRKVADKKIDEMNLSELEEVWITLRARFGGEL